MRVLVLTIAYLELNDRRWGLAFVVERLCKVRGLAWRDNRVLQGLSRARPSCASKKNRRKYLK